MQPEHRTCAVARTKKAGHGWIGFSFVVRLRSAHCCFRGARRGVALRPTWRVMERGQSPEETVQPVLHCLRDAVQSQRGFSTTRNIRELLMSALQHKLLHRRSNAEPSSAGEQSDVSPLRHVPPPAPHTKLQTVVVSWSGMMPIRRLWMKTGDEAWLRAKGTSWRLHPLPPAMLPVGDRLRSTWSPDASRLNRHQL